jgi:hypothetical protein
MTDKVEDQNRASLEAPQIRPTPRSGDPFDGRHQSDLAVSGLLPLQRLFERSREAGTAPSFVRPRETLSTSIWLHRSGLSLMASLHASGSES